MMMYISALKMQTILGFGKIHNVSIPLFNIDIPDHILRNKSGIHDSFHGNGQNKGRIPFAGYKKFIENYHCDFLSLEGLYQNIHNFPPLHQIPYNEIFPPLNMTHTFGGEEDLVIHIRGGDILAGISDMYCLLPPEFYEYLINQTQKRPIFYGQLDQSPYLDEIKNRFPNAIYINSQGAEKDFDFIRKAKHIVLCLSTFSWMAAWLSSAQNIYMPVAGLFNPAHHFYGNLLPTKDPRYHFFLFPLYFAKHVNEYRSYLDPIRKMWTTVSPTDLERIYYENHPSLDDELLSLDYKFLSESSSNYSSLYREWNEKGVLNLFTSQYNAPKQPFFSIDRAFYISQNPMIGMEISLGIYKNEIDHYLMKGQYLGYKTHQSS